MTLKLLTSELYPGKKPLGKSYNHKRFIANLSSPKNRPLNRVAMLSLSHALSIAAGSCCF